MRVLHLTYRFGKDIVGGAEQYLYMLSRKLAQFGIEVDIVTTKTKKMYLCPRFGVIWDNAIKSDIETHDNLLIYRYPTFNLPKILHFGLGWVLFLWRHLEKWRTSINITNLPFEQTGILGRGWDSLELYNNFPIRWLKKKAEIILRDTGVMKINIEIMSPKNTALEFYINDIFITLYECQKNWDYVRLNFAPQNNIICKIKSAKVWKFLKDNNKALAAVRRIEYCNSNGEIKKIPLELDYKDFFKLEKAQLINWYITRAIKRAKFCNYLFDLLRGPISYSLLMHIKKTKKNYDLILGMMMPYNTLNYAVWLGKKYNIPVILLPLMHIDDEFYHWRHYYESLLKADRVLALSQFAKEKFYDKLGVKAEVVGAGVDVEEFLDPNISGDRFRSKFKLGNIPIVLFVGRKSYSKRYDLLIKAVDLVNQKQNCRLVIIGPDEDQMPISSLNTIYLGPQDRKTVLDAYDACDIFANMSESESFGIVLLEAWMRKKPVIGNRYCGPFFSLIEDGINGFLCRNEFEVAEKIKILLNDRKLANNLGRNGFYKVLQNYTWDIVGNKIKQIYEEVVEEYRRKQNKKN